jgi:hypothetical protein
MDRRDFLTGVAVTTIITVVPLVEIDEERLLWDEIEKRKPPTSWNPDLGCMQRFERIHFRGKSWYVMRNKEGVYCGADYD